MFTHGVNVNEFCNKSPKERLEIIESDSAKIDSLNTYYIYLKRDCKNQYWKSVYFVKKT